MDLSYTVTNPFGIHGFSVPILQQVIPYALVATLIVASIGANLSLVLRWRKARGDERQQIKGFALFVGVIVSLFLIIEIIGQTLLPQVYGSLIYTVAYYFAWIGYPVVSGVIVLKNCLYDVEIVIETPGGRLCWM